MVSRATGRSPSRTSSLESSQAQFQRCPRGFGEPRAVSAIELVDPRLDGEMRMVKRSDEVVRHVIIAGREAFTAGTFAKDLGTTRFGRLLRRTKAATRTYAIAS